MPTPATPPTTAAPTARFRAVCASLGLTALILVGALACIGVPAPLLSQLWRNPFAAALGRAWESAQAWRVAAMRDEVDVSTEAVPQAVCCACSQWTARAYSLESSPIALRSGVLLPNGMILPIGGVGSGYARQYYDPYTGTWSAGPPEAICGSGLWATLSCFLTGRWLCPGEVFIGGTDTNDFYRTSFTLDSDGRPGGSISGGRDLYPASFAIDGRNGGSITFGGDLYPTPSSLDSHARLGGSVTGEGGLLPAGISLDPQRNATSRYLPRGMLIVGDVSDLPTFDRTDPCLPAPAATGLTPLPPEPSAPQPCTPPPARADKPPSDPSTPAPPGPSVPPAPQNGATEARGGGSIGGCRPHRGQATTDLADASVRATPFGSRAPPR